MNPSTGHLVKDLTFAPEAARSQYEPIPPELARAAHKKLAGKNEATVSLTSGGKLSKWAAGRRNERKIKNRMVKNSRKTNRGR